MIARQGCDGEGLLGALRSAVANLESRVEEVNALNVFPVPDGDTGSNMLATLRAALNEAEAVAPEQRTAGSVAGAVGFGALMGARGNSGVILSQVLRGMADGIDGRRRINALDLANAFDVGTRTAYAAVVRPVEGTILTVVREAAAAAVAAAEREPEMEVVLAAATEAAELAVARTPALLPVLREAGVVDAGGEGFFLILQGALRQVVGVGAAFPGRETARPTGAALIARSHEGFGYETMFLVTPASGSLDPASIRAYLETLGDSVLVAGDARAVRVHVHNDRPDEVIHYGLTLGHLGHISVENLDHQARAAREARAARFTGASDVAAQAVGGAVPGSVQATPAGTATAASRRGAEVSSLNVAGSGLPMVGEAAAPGRVEGEPARPDGESRSGTLPVAQPGPAPGTLLPAHAGPGIVAVADGDGLRRIFESFGVGAIVGGGQGDNPSTGELVAAIEQLPGREVLVLPNNRNVRLAAEQAASMLGDRCVVVVPTRNAAEGVAALLALDAARDARTNAPAMLGAARAVQTLQVADAVRDARMGERKVKRGQTIVLDPDEGLVAAGGDRTEVVLAAARTLRPGFELLTLYYGDGADLAEAEALSFSLQGLFSGVEVELIHGGQPHYRYLIAAE